MDVPISLLLATRYCHFKEYVINYGVYVELKLARVISSELRV